MCDSKHKHLSTFGAGVSGNIRMDSQADRVGDYAVWHLPASSSRYELLKIVLMNTEGVEQVHTEERRYWGPSGFTPPRDTPKCGFDGSLCPVDNTRE
jgi:atrial natriuretic peptide receptor A